MVRLAYLVIAFSSIALVPAAPAQTHVDVFDKKSNRTGGVIIDERTGRVDVYDRDSNRLGYGLLDRTTGRVDFYDVRGNRVGSATLDPKGGTIPKDR